MIHALGFQRIGRGREITMVLEPPIVSTVFVQANTVQGFRFWDETGVLANRFAERFRSVTYADALRCVQPLDPLDPLLELRITTHSIWLAFRPGVSWTTVRQEASSLVEWIARGIHVTQLSRIGLRVTVLWGGNESEQVNQAYRDHIIQAQSVGWTELGEFGGGELVIQLQFDHITARVSVSTVKNVETKIHTRVPGIEIPEPSPDVERPDYAIQLDVDFADERLLHSIDIKPHLNRSIELLQERLIPFIDRITERGGQ